VQIAASAGGGAMRGARSVIWSSEGGVRSSNASTPKD